MAIQDTAMPATGASSALCRVWGAAIGALTLIASEPAFLGVIVIFPVLGHASWHLYERLISEG